MLVQGVNNDDPDIHNYFSELYKKIKDLVAEEGETIHSLVNSGSQVSVASLVEQGITRWAELISIEIGATGDVVDEGGGEQSHTQSHHWEMVVGLHTEKCL